MSDIIWGLIAEHPRADRLPANRAPRPGDAFSRKNEREMRIRSVIDHGGEIWIILENGEEESGDEITPIDVS